MMNRILSIFVIAGIVSSTSAFAQNEIDALRYGQQTSIATARSIGLGGAGGSYGGDFSSLSINPAGLGVYRSSELMITPTLRFNNLHSTYLDNSVDRNNSKFSVNNLGIVFTKAAQGKDYEKSNWKTVSFGIGFNRVADYNSKGRYEGVNSESSITDLFSADAIANGVGQNLVPPYGYLGYQSFLLFDDGASIPRENILNNGGSLNQTKSWKSKGAANEWTISLGGNYKEKLLLGATLGILSYKYDNQTHFVESDESGNTNNDFDYLDFHSSLNTIGAGVNLKLGAIYVVNDMFRVGAAFHTPTWSSLNDISDYDITSNTEQLKARTNQASSDPKTFVQPDKAYGYDYSLRTPWHALISGTVFLGKNGFITADYEFVDYASMKYNMDELDWRYEMEVNNNIKNTFTAAHNIRVGVEGKKDNLMGRVGFAYHTSPFQRAEDFGGAGLDLSIGAGVRFGGFFMDLGYMHSLVKTSEYAYPALSSGIATGIANLKNNQNIVALTLGVKF